MGLQKNDIIKNYFHAGYSYNEILELLLCHHNINLSLRQLNRILRKESLYRRHNKVPDNIVRNVIRGELEGSCINFGYRAMHLRIRNMGINSNRETVRIILKELDPESVQLRFARRLRRRKYVNLGPNYLWHMDAYDKLKSFGFAIHGAIDGYSRKIMCLKVGSTNNDPKVIGYYFIEAVKRQSLLPRCIRADRGTENIVVAGLQRYFRRHFNNVNNNDKYFLFSPPTQNQRIESWWSILKQMWSTWWINFFKDFIEEGLDLSLHHHLHCLRFCFTRLLQKELDRLVQFWNNHHMRQVRHSSSPAGRPNILFFAPQLSNGMDYKFPVNDEDLALARDFTSPPSSAGCCMEMETFGNMIMNERLIALPINAESAKELFWILVHEIDNIV